MYTTFERFEIQMTKAQALQGSHPGPCDEEELSDEQENKARILWIAAGNIREELKP